MKRTTLLSVICLGMAAALMAMGLVFTGCKKKTEFKANLPEKFNGKEAQLIDYMDSTVVAQAMIEDGTVEFVDITLDSVSMPRFSVLMVDGRIKAYYIIEPGVAVTDSLGYVRGTALNDRLARVLAQLDSVDNLDDSGLYADFINVKFQENRDNVIGDYLGVEMLKFADPQKVDSLLACASPEFRDSRRVRYYTAMAKKRLLTSPGQKYTDIDGETASGAPLKLSQLMKPGQYTLVDMWASWCPYCIKELPALEKLYADYKAKGLEIVGVAVRDNIDDTRNMVKKKNISWPVLYNTQRRPYDIYGFSGIPHHILIGPDGMIISRGENVEQLSQRLSALRAPRQITSLPRKLYNPMLP